MSGAVHSEDMSREGEGKARTPVQEKVVVWTLEAMSEAR